MNLGPYKGEGKPSCTKAVSLNYNGASVHMKQGGFILVNGKEISTLPVMVGDVRIRAASSLFVIGEFSSTQNTRQSRAHEARQVNCGQQIGSLDATDHGGGSQGQSFFIFSYYW